MSKTIFLRVGNSERVVLSDLVNSLSAFLRILRDFDATVSEQARGSQKWEVTTITMNSPVLLGVTPITKPKMQDFGEAIEIELLESSAALTQKKERTKRMSDSALSGIGQLARLSTRIGPSSIFLAANGHPKRESVIGETTMQAVRELTGVSYEAFGTLTGKLEAITVHGTSEFRIWDASTGKVVRCKYESDKEPKILKLLRKTVVVSGLISSNSAGTPISVEVEHLDEIGTPQELPTIKQMAGFIKDYTGGRRLKQYLKEIADE